MWEQMEAIDEYTKKHGLHWRLCKSSLLSAVRDFPRNGFGIRHEKDEDVCFDPSYRAEHGAALAQLAPWSRFGIFQPFNEAKVDFKWFPWPPNTTIIRIPYGRVNFPVASNYEEELYAQYPDWRTPRIDTARAGINRAFGCAIISDNWSGEPWDRWFNPTFLIVAIPYLISTMFIYRPDHPVYSRLDECIEAVENGKSV